MADGIATLDAPTTETPASANARSRWEIPALIAITVLAFLRKLALSTQDPDTYWHIATGRYIVSHGTVPHTDPFSWYGIAKELTWTVQEWLFGVLAYAVHALGGFTGLSIMASLFVAGVSVGLYYLIKARTGSVLLSLALASFSCIVIAGLGAVRPQLLTNLLLVVTLLLLQNKKYFWTIPVMVLSLNLHGGNWPVFVVVIALWAIGREWRVIPLALVAPLMNPKGLELLAYPFHTLSYDFSQISEFAPTTLLYSDHQIFLATMILLVLLVDFNKVSLRDAVLAGAFTVLGLSSFRHTVFWYIVVIPVLAPYMVERVRAIGATIRRTLEPTPLRGFTTFTPDQSISLWATASLVAAIALTYPMIGAVRSGDWPHDVVTYPSAAVVSYLKEHGTDHTFTEYNPGGYFIYHGIKPMIDSRADLYSSISTPGEEMMDDYFALLRTMSLGEFVEKYDIRTVVVTDNMPMSLVLKDNPNYQVVLSDGGMTIYDVIR